MIKKRAIKLVAALRSNKFKQSRGVLKDDDKYSCFGLACKISKISKFNQDECYLNQRANLHPKILKFYGFKSSVGYFGYKKVSWPDSIQNPSLKKCVTLQSLNKKGATFSQLADFIELNWKIL